jgi:subtilisin family serine protease
LRKFVILLLVAAMVLGSLVGILIYAGIGVPGQNDPFADVPAPVIRSNRFADFRGADLLQQNFKDQEGVFYTFTFDMATKWPQGDRMPDTDLPARILEKGKYMGLGLSLLSEKGITGKGISVAVIDKPILREHEAFQGNLNYIEVSPEHAKMGNTHFLGAAVAGILAGKNGVAPEANLYYFAVPDDMEPYARYAEAMGQILELQNTLPKEGKIRIVAVAHGLDQSDVAANTGGAKDWSQAIDRARQEGIIVIYPGMPGLAFTATGCPPEKDRDDPANYELWSWSRAKRQVAEKLQTQGASTWDDAGKLLNAFLTEETGLDSLQAEAINTFVYTGYLYKDYVNFEEWLKVTLAGSGQAIAIPADYITVPTVSGPGQYTYYGAGGLSWSTAYMAGLAALGLQVKPDATEQELFQALWDSATPFYGELRLVSPTGYIARLMGD